MGKEERGDELIHKWGIVGKLNIGHSAGNFQRLLKRRNRSKRHSRSGERAVPDKLNPFHINIGYQSDGNRLRNIQ